MLIDLLNFSYVKEVYSFADIEIQQSQLGGKQSTSIFNKHNNEELVTLIGLTTDSLNPENIIFGEATNFPLEL